MAEDRQGGDGKRRETTIASHAAAPYRLPFRLALPAYRLFFHYRYSRPIHLHIQDWNRFAHHHRQIQLHGPLYLLLLACCDILSYGFRRPLHCFGGHLQARE
jgi:hypothetical protein